MKELKITDMRVLSGDSAFLIDDGKTSILYDTGFGFTAGGLCDKLKDYLGHRSLDYIFLTHSHYDHVLGAPHVKRLYPDAKIVAGEYADRIFKKPSARQAMRDLDQKFAKTCGVDGYEDLSEELSVDIAVRDGDRVVCGDMEFEVINLPGHTKCSIGFYLAENKLLLGSETLGVYFGKNTYLPFFLVGYEMSLESFRKARALNIESILLPHWGMVDKNEAKNYLENSERSARATCETVKTMLSEGKTKEEILDRFTKEMYLDHVRPTYPRDAFNLNTSIIIELIKKEFSLTQEREDGKI